MKRQKDHPLHKRKLVALKREEVIAVVNCCTIAVELAANDMPADFKRDLTAAVNRLMRSYRLRMCDCCNRVSEGRDE